MSFHNQIAISLPGLPEVTLHMSLPAWELFLKLQNAKSGTVQKLAISTQLRGLRKAAGLSRLGLAQKATDLGDPCTYAEVRYWEEKPPEMGRLVRACQLLGTTPIRVIIQSLGLNPPQNEIDEVVHVYQSFGARVQPQEAKNTRQLNAMNKKLDRALNDAIKQTLKLRGWS
jgi:hypothetical protein